MLILARLLVIAPFVVLLAMRLLPPVVEVAVAGVVVSMISC